MNTKRLSTVETFGTDPALEGPSVEVSVAMRIQRLLTAERLSTKLACVSLVV
jgi:hypothetical protein